MPTFVADCPRCGSSKITFDVNPGPSIGLAYGWQALYEIFCICRNCNKSSVHRVKQKDADARIEFGIEDNINRTAEWIGFLSIKDNANRPIPLHLPEQIETVFKEACTCLSVNCWNAAGAMFRSAIDLTTKALLPAEDTAGLNGRTRRDLGLRLPWLISNGKLASDLAGLSTCIREDGNDGVHAANLSEPDAEDLYDFAFALLERLYTEPARIAEAERRREERRGRQRK